TGTWRSSIGSRGSARRRPQGSGAWYHQFGRRKQHARNLRSSPANGLLPSGTYRQTVTDPTRSALEDRPRGSGCAALQAQTSAAGPNSWGVGRTPEGEEDGRGFSRRPRRARRSDLTGRHATSRHRLRIRARAALFRRAVQAGTGAGVLLVPSI